MSKVIIKIGPTTERVNRESIKTVTLSNSPQTTIQYATNSSVVFFNRNPWYVIITDPEHTQSICRMLIASESVEVDERTSLINMAFGNIHSLMSNYMISQMYDDFAQVTINALRNSGKEAIKSYEDSSTTERIKELLLTSDKK